jgi:hypothetical protein
VSAPFLRYSSYLQEKYGGPVYRVPVDAGLGCPHRWDQFGIGGCRFCGESAGRAAFVAPSDTIPQQISKGSGFLRRRYKANRFILYFQAYSGTHGDISSLRHLYDSALAEEDFAELIVSTRPDCIDESVAELLSSYRTRDRDVWVELGLQSAKEETLERINRRHGLAEFEAAVNLLRSAGVKLAVHVMFGLPGEGLSDCLDTIAYVNRFRPEGIKIHNVHVTSDAALSHDFLAGEVTVPSSERHLDYVVEALQLLPPDTVIMRLTCDSDPGTRLAPKRFLEKQKFYRKVEDRLRALGVAQGSRYHEVQQCR